MIARNTGVPEDRQIKLRIGINLGDVIVEGDDIYGDGVNVAARLEGLAKPGGTISEHAGDAGGVGQVRSPAHCRPSRPNVGLPLHSRPSPEGC